MTIYLHIAGRVHGMRNWSAVPRIGEDVWVENAELPNGSKGNRALTVIAVLWNAEHVDVNLQKPDH